MSTRNRQAQAYFDQGMRLVFAFNHEAAIKSFERAYALDPDLAMAQWGIALALGPNINAPMDAAAHKAAYAARAERDRVEAEGHAGRARVHRRAGDSATALTPKPTPLRCKSRTRTR